MGSLQALVSKLEAELMDEKRWRDHMEAEVTEIESMLRSERTSRGTSLQHLSVELEEKMKGLTDQIESGLHGESRELAQRAEKMEAALMRVMKCVEKGIAAGGVPGAPSEASTGLPGGGASTHMGSESEGTPTGTTLVAGACRSQQDAESMSWQARRATQESSNAGGGALRKDPGNAKNLVEATEPLLQVWGELQEENLRLRQQRKVLADKQSTQSGRTSRDEAGEGRMARLSASHERRGNSLVNDAANNTNTTVASLAARSRMPVGHQQGDSSPLSTPLGSSLNQPAQEASRFPFQRPGAGVATYSTATGSGREPRQLSSDVTVAGQEASREAALDARAARSPPPSHPVGPQGFSQFGGAPRPFQQQSPTWSHGTTAQNSSRQQILPPGNRPNETRYAQGGYSPNYYGSRR